MRELVGVWVLYILFFFFPSYSWWRSIAIEGYGRACPLFLVIIVVFYFSTLSFFFKTMLGAYLLFSLYREAFWDEPTDERRTCVCFFCFLNKLFLYGVK
jgi:hypothetical protein